MTDACLIHAAAEAARHAYCSYSGFHVGAALLTTTGEVFTGVNVENASYGLTLCAERSAVSAAIAAGVRDFAAIAIAADGAEPVFPCGACRQVLAEFGPPHLRIILASIHPLKITGLHTLSDLLPHGFSFRPGKTISGVSAGPGDGADRCLPGVE